MFLCILGIFLLILSFIVFYNCSKVKISKNKEQELYKNTLQKEILKLEQNKNNLIKSQSTKKDQINEVLKKWGESRKKQIELYIEKEKVLANQNIERQRNLMQQSISEMNQEIENFKNTTDQEKQKIQNELNELKSSLSAGIKARLREQQEKEKINFYKLSLNEVDLNDVKKLENLKLSLHKPVILSKLIWTQYFQKQMTELCDRILGKQTVCGIYKITNLLTKECYIGQSVDISKRFKDHCKCGLGIQASATNKLYNAMQKDGVWNFSFELLEECPKELLNEKEKFWIQMYQSNQFGYNIQKGSK